MLGIRADFNGLRIEPCLPHEWTNLTAKRVFRGATYEIHYERGEAKGVYVDGVLCEGNQIPLAAAGARVNVQVIF